MPQESLFGGGKSPEDRLESWKEIAVFLRRGVSTVQRWERTEGLPVRRHVHGRLGSVYAYRAELEAWRLQRTASWRGETALPVESACRLLLEGRAIPLREGKTVIGRSPDATLVINHARVSRHHACITTVGSEAVLQDLNSRNGTFVRGHRLESAHTLVDGDEIQIGPAQLLYLSDVDGEPTESDG